MDLFGLWRNISIRKTYKILLSIDSRKSLISQKTSNFVKKSISTPLPEITEFHENRRNFDLEPPPFASLSPEIRKSGFWGQNTFFINRPLFAKIGTFLKKLKTFTLKPFPLCSILLDYGSGGTRKEQESIVIKALGTRDTIRTWRA